MQRKMKLFSGAMAALMITGVALTPVAASASEEGRRNTALGLGAVTGYLFTRRGSKVPAFAGLAGTAYAYKRYDDAIKDRHKREKLAYGRHRYRQGYQRGHSSGPYHRQCRSTWTARV